MPAINIKAFAGEVPRLTAKLLETHNAQEAINCKLLSGGLRSWQAPLDVQKLRFDGILDHTATAQSGGQAPDFIQLAATASTVLGDYDGWTIRITAGTGIGQHRKINMYMGNTVGQLFYAYVDKTWTVVPDNTSVYELFDEPTTKFAQSIYLFGKGTAQENWLGWLEDVDVSRGPIAGDTLERTYFTGTDKPRVTDNTIVDQGGEWQFPQKSFLMGVPAPATKPTTAVIGAGQGSPVERSYVYTFVNSYGEEGPPSLPSSPTITVDTFGISQTVDITAMDQAPAGDFDITKWRIYRVATGTQGAAFLFVAEVTINLSSPQYNDSIDETALGETLTTTDFDPPPIDMIGLTALPFGVFAGFRKNELLFSEPFQPHAWPTRYRLTTTFPIVSLGHYGITVVVTTTGGFYLVTGIDPAAMAMSELVESQACTSKRGLVSTPAGVIYPSPDGAVLVGPGVQRLITDKLMNRTDWQELKPDTIHAAFHDGRYMAFYSTAPLLNGEFVGKGFILDLRDPQFGFKQLDFYRYALHSEPQEDRFYLVRFTTDDLNDIEQWQGKGSKLSYKWVSKRFVLGNHSLSAAKIVGDFSAGLSAAEIDAITTQRAAQIADNLALLANLEALPGEINGHEINGIEINGDGLETVIDVAPAAPTVVFTLRGQRVDEETMSEKFMKSVTDDRVFRMNSGSPGKMERYKEVEIELSGTVDVEQIWVGETVSELRVLIQAE